MHFLMTSLCALCLSGQIFAQGIGPSDIKRPPLKPPAEKYVPQAPIPAPVYQAPPQPSSAVLPTFTQPGILSYQGGQWVGGDHLFNLSSNIPVVVDLVKSDKLQLDLTQEMLQKRLEAAFIKQGISVNVEATGRPPLPFFNLFVMVVPLGDGVTAYCSGRLFELVDNSRANLARGVFWQAITWEDQQLIVASPEQIISEITSTVDAIGASFLDSYNTFQRRR